MSNGLQELRTTLNTIDAEIQRVREQRDRTYLEYDSLDKQFARERVGKWIVSPSISAKKNNSNKENNQENTNPQLDEKYKEKYALNQRLAELQNDRQQVQNEIDHLSFSTDHVPSLVLG